MCVIDGGSLEVELYLVLYLNMERMLAGGLGESRLEKVAMTGTGRKSHSLWWGQGGSRQVCSLFLKIQFLSGQFRGNQNSWAQSSRKEFLDH